jgi:hypothetical protein
MSTRLAWLAGILDGEGCFYVRLTNKGKYKSSVGNIETRITVQATSIRMIEKIQEIYNEYGISYLRTPPKKLLEHHKFSYIIDVRRRWDVLKLINLVLPFLVVKDIEAIAIKEFLDKFPDDGRSGLKPNNDTKLALVSTVSELKRIA